MEIKEGDLVVTLPAVEKIKAIIKKLPTGAVGVVSSITPKFDRKTVYEVLIEGETYYLFEDEIQKLED
tara:strand:+ start:383 stop:586 length:204 start_codon:yes stop_codon:yes gene_type:complete